MTAIAKKLNYRREGVTHSIELYDTPSDVGSDCIGLRVDGQTVYARIGETDDEDASDLRVRRDSETFAILNIARQEFPTGFVAMFQNSCPTGWIRESSFDGYFIRGASAYNAIPQGSSSHTHTFSPGTATTTAVLEKYDKIDTNTNETNMAMDEHTHPFSVPETTSSDATHLPPYINIIFCRKV